MSVRFAGGRARSGPLALGQANMARAYRHLTDPAMLNLSAVAPVPESMTLDDVTQCLRSLVMRHETLRTRYPGDGRQHVAGEGELAVSVLEAAGDVEGQARAVQRELAGRWFEHPVELPLRVGVVTVDGRPRRVVFVVSHLSLDGTGVAMLRQEWGLLAAGQPLPEPPRSCPIDVAELESTPQIRRLTADAVRYWDRRMAHVPQGVFAVPGALPGQACHELRVRSRRALDGLDGIAARTRATRSGALLTVVALLIAHRTERRDCVLTSMSSNRFLPQMHRHFGSTAQDALVYLDLDVSTVDDAVRGTRSATLAAYRSSWFDAEDVWERIDHHTHMRGIHHSRDCVLNDRSGVPVPARGPALADPELTPGLTRPMHALFTLVVTALDDEADFAVCAHPQVLAPAELTAFGEGIVAVLDAARDTDVPLADIPSLVHFGPLPRGEGWVLVDACWVCVAEVRRLVEEVTGSPCLVVAEPDPVLGHRLSCWVSSRATPQELHRACLAALPRYPAAVTPHRYLLTGSAPSTVDSTGEWRRQPLLAQGTGRTAAER